MRHFVGTLAALCVAAISSGCAFMDNDNRRTLNLLDRHVSPDSVAARVALAPLAMPAGTVALAADIAVVHPITVVPEAAEDVYDLYWKPRDVEFLRRALFFAPMVVLTPPTFAVDWVFRSIFDVN